MSSKYHRDKATDDYKLHRLRLEHYSRHILPQSFEQEDLNWAGLDVASLKDLELALAGHSDEECSQADLMPYIDFILFRKTNEIEWLESAIVRQEALTRARGNNYNEVFHNLIYFRAQKFEASGQFEDLRAAIKAAEEVMSSTPALHPDRQIQEADLSRLRTYASKMSRAPPVVPAEAAEETDALTRIASDRGIMDALFGGDTSPLRERLKRELSMSSGTERVRLADTYGLAQMFFLCEILASGKEISSNSKEVIEALEVVRSELGFAPVRSRSMYLGVLAMILYRSSWTPDGHDLKTIQKAIEVLEELVKIVDDTSDSPAQIIASHPFVKTWPSNYGEKGDYILALIIRSIDASDFNPSRLHYLGVLGSLMQRRHKALHDPADLKKAVSLLEEQWCSSIDKEAGSLVSGVRLVNCYLILSYLPGYGGDDSFLKKAANLADELLGHPMSPRLREKLLVLRCKCYASQWHFSNDMGLLEPAIELAESLRAQFPYNRGHGPGVLAMLSRLYRSRSTLVYGQNDLNKALRVATEAVDMADSLTAGVDTTNVDILISQSMALDELAQCLMMLYQFHRDKAFIEEAIRLITRSIELSQRLGDADPNKIIHPWIMADLHFKLFHRTGDGKKLTQCIEWCREAVQGASASPGLERSLKRSLSSYLVARYASDEKQYEGDKSESMSLARDALSYLEQSTLFMYIYTRDRNEDILKEAIRLARLSLPKEGEFSKNMRLFGMTYGQEPADWVFGELTVAKAILARMRYHGDTDDAEEALECLLRCSRSTSQDSIVAIETAIFLSDPIFTSKLKISDLAIATKKAIHMLPHYCSRALKRPDIQDMLTLCAGLPAAAAASAIEAGHSVVEALKLLEAGRAILTTYLLGTRTDTLGLDDDEELVKLVQKKLENLELVNEEGVGETSSTSNKWQVDKAYMLNTEVESILERLGSQGQESILGMPSAAEMRAVGYEGRKCAVVVINAHSLRCDAILIHDDKIEGLYLPRLNIESAKIAAECLDFTQKRSLPPRIQERVWAFVLAWLWDVAVEPILDFLGYTTTLSESDPKDWPRVWWIPTGELSQLPFHAAGIHDPRSPSSALDRVVSSYSSSVKALIYTQRIALQKKKSLETSSSRSSSHKDARVVLASMSKTPAQRELIHVETEVREVKSIISTSATVRELCQPKKQEIMKELQSCDVFHFAGHGASYTDDPDASCLLVEDWQTNPLTVKDILGVKLHKNAPFLAYLSACSTGANRTAQLLDEVIHLVTSFQLAGFQHVVGSLWAVSDLSSSEVAKDVYRRLSGNFEPDVDVALALHFAVQRLRRTSSTADSRFANTVETEIEQDSEIDKLLARLDRSFSPAYDEEEEEGNDEEHEETVRDPRLSSLRRRLAHRETMRNPVLWAPYFHTGF